MAIVGEDLVEEASVADYRREYLAQRRAASASGAATDAATDAATMREKIERGVEVMLAMRRGYDGDEDLPGDFYDDDSCFGTALVGLREVLAFFDVSGSAASENGVGQDTERRDVAELGRFVVDLLREETATIEETGEEEADRRGYRLLVWEPYDEPEPVASTALEEDLARRLAGRYGIEIRSAASDAAAEDRGV